GAGPRDAPRRAHGPRRLRPRARPRRGQRLRRARGTGAPAPVGGRACGARPARAHTPAGREAARRGGAVSLTVPRGADVLVCGASFAGLAVARELAGAGADVLVVDRYEIGARATSACAAPTPWLHAMGVARAIRQEIPCMAFHTPHGSARFRLPWSWSAFDYRELCRELWEQCDARFEIGKVEGRAGRVVRTDRGELDSDLIVDALGWRRVLAP